MPVNILMPALSPTMEKGNLSKWLKKEGDQVKAGDVIAEIETDKATMEVEAVDEGTLGKIVVAEGTQDVPVNQVIAVLLEEGEDASAIKAAPSAPAPKAEAKQETKAALSFETPAARAPQDEVEKKRPRPEGASPGPASGRPGDRLAPVSKDDGAKTNGKGGRVFASPLARRLAKEFGIDVSRVQGSGPHGRVVARDVEQAKAGGALRAPAAAPAGAPPGIQAPSDEQIRALFEEGSYEFVPHDGMRKTIAKRLVESKLMIPHYYLTVDVELDALFAARHEINAAASMGEDGKPRFRVSVNDLLIKALALALIKIPDANVSWTEAGMLKHKHADVGVAVAIPGGLITPIIRHAEEKSMSAIATEMKDFIARARTRKLKPHEYQGGSSALSNLGMYGIREFSAVINPPHATILAVGAGEERAVARKGKIEAATVMTATLSADHRAVDGALGAELLDAFRHFVEKPISMLA
ncbi:MAG: pyruvate dehydrogenase complex dihydrolipoamide acetyltransferase [Bradyrhizobiaceae bacterium]|nr:pyruvate dehydrogenase complex dihydrolipoamide acetyltransferase [Bradyrhizobiaceae bacterium]